jgi:transcriptional regulator with XRE-family HTH domain
MFDIAAWLDRAKARNELASDYKLAIVLGVSPSSITNYRAGKTMPDERVTLRLCELSGDDAEHVIACIQSMRAANDDAADLWRRVAARLKGAGGAIGAIFVFVLVACGVVDVTSSTAYAAPVASAGLYIMSNLLRRFLMRLVALMHHPRHAPAALR